MDCPPFQPSYNSKCPDGWCMRGRHGPRCLKGPGQGRPRGPSLREGFRDFPKVSSTHRQENQRTLLGEQRDVFKQVYACDMPLVPNSGTVQCTESRVCRQASSTELWVCTFSVWAHLQFSACTHVHVYTHWGFVCTGMMQGSRIHAQ